MEAMQWHKVTISFEGPALTESSEDNPFTNYRLDVTFSHGDRQYVVPGFYAADGHAAETGAEGGAIWQVRFRPDEEGEWTYSASFRKGEGVAVSDEPEAGEPIAFDGATGKIVVGKSDKSGRDFRAKGRLQYVGERYLQFAGNGEYFLKGGADSPENFLAFKDFDGTHFGGELKNRDGEAKVQKSLHAYAPHAADWKSGDPLWKGDKGKNIIGAVNYLAAEGMNSVYFLTMNIAGDGKDVWPYTGYHVRDRFDCSKLDQWEMVFDHMQSLGLMLHIVTQETENEMLLDNGDTGPQRKLYYRELIARFGHHLALTWNMGEENGPANFTPNGQNTAQQKAMTDYFEAHDPYQNFVVIHTHANPADRYKLFLPLLGHTALDGPSIQIGHIGVAHSETKTWLHKSDSAGHQWVVNIDEIGPAHQGVDPDAKENNNQDSVRHMVLWGNLMAGGGGVEWYFGYKNAHNDLNSEDWRSRDRFWDYTRHALNFFQEHLPFATMVSRDDLLTGATGYCFARPGEIYAVYLPTTGTAMLDLGESDHTYDVLWFDPRHGGALQQGHVTNIAGPGNQSLGSPPDHSPGDWVALVKVKK
jgi:hypothetical protein